MQETSIMLADGEGAALRFDALYQWNDERWWA